MGSTSVREVLRKTDEILRTATLGFETFKGADAERRASGLHNVAVFGRSVTFVLQNLRSIVGADAFDAWYAPHLASMKRDPLFAFFVKLRNTILKQGPPQMWSSTHIGFLSTEMAREMWRFAPPGATRFFIGDHLGGSGFEVDLGEGRTETYYVSLPESWDVDVRLHMPGLPASRVASLEDACRDYLEALAAIVADARREFGATP